MTTTAHRRTCTCSRPITDGYACHECASEARRHLRTIAALAEAIDDKRAGTLGTCRCSRAPGRCRMTPRSASWKPEGDRP